LCEGKVSSFLSHRCNPQLTIENDFAVVCIVLYVLLMHKYRVAQNKRDYWKVE